MQAAVNRRLKKSVRGVLIWVLVAFGPGGLVIAFNLYASTWQKLAIANTDLENANPTITSITKLITVQPEDSKTLQENLGSTTLHQYVLEALSGVRGASLAVTTDDNASTRLSLIRASEALKPLSDLLGADRKDVFSALQQSASQALTNM